MGLPPGNRWLILGGVFSLILAVAAVAAEQPSADQLARLERWLRDRDETIRLDAVQELAKVRSTAAGELLVGALADSSPAIRATAAWALGGYRGRAVIAALRARLRDDHDRVRASAVWALCHAGDRAGLAAIIAIARDDPSGNARFRAVWGLGILGDRQALPVAIQALADPNVSVRERAAVNAIAALADHTVPGRLVKMANHPQAATRRLVMYLLSRYPSREALPVLAAAMRDADATVRGEAALTAGRLRGHSLLANVTTCLADPDDHVRGSAAYAAGLIGHRSVIPRLRELLDDEAAFVRAIAAESLQRLGEHSATPPEGFRAEELFTYPMFSPTVMEFTN